MTGARAAPAAALVAAATLYVGIHWGSTVGGGADSYGYVSQAALWRQGRLSIQQDIVRASPWPLAIETWAPLGYRRAAGAEEIVPLYPPGLPLLMAAFQAVGGFCAAFLVVPLCGALTVWLTYVLTQRLSGRPLVAVAAALLVATSPIFLYQLMNPMSDVPVTAAWTLSIVLAIAGWPVTAGLAAAAAILIRPNLAALALVLAVWLAATRGRPWRFAIGVAPALVVLAAINQSLYGAPWIFGYGAVPDLYAWSSWSTNARQFTAWLVQTQTPVVAVASVYFLRPGWFAARIPRPRLLVGGLIAATIASYLFYTPFDAWWYLRFLLPMWPMLMVLVVAGMDAVVARSSVLAARSSLAHRSASRGTERRWVVSSLVVIVALLTANGVRVAADRHAFDVGRAERRYIDVARFVATHTDPGAVMLSVQHSGTLRLYAGRLTLRFDQLDAAWLDRAVEFLQATGRHPYVVLEGDEVRQFAERFGAANEAGRLAWRPLATLANPPTMIYDALDRRRTDEPLAIADTASRRIGWRCDPPPP